MADLYTAEAVMDFWDVNATAEMKAKRARIEEIKKDQDTARKYINDAIARYRKDKTRSRSKAKAEDPFIDLADYTSKDDIQESFGWGTISERERDRLWNLWDLREKSKNKAVLEDRVVELLQVAARAVSSPHAEEVFEYDQERCKMWREAEKIARENLMRG